MSWKLDDHLEDLLYKLWPWTNFFLKIFFLPTSLLNREYFSPLECVTFLCRKKNISALYHLNLITASKFRTSNVFVFENGCQWVIDIPFLRMTRIRKWNKRSRRVKFNYGFRVLWYVVLNFQSYVMMVGESLQQCIERNHWEVRWINDKCSNLKSSLELKFEIRIMKILAVFQSTS